MTAWTAPATWAAAVVTTTQMNTEIRDHAVFLKGALDLITNATAADTSDTMYLQIARSASAGQAFGAKVTGDAALRFVITAGGMQTWGAGAGAIDATLERISAGILRFTESRVRATGAGTTTVTFDSHVTGDGSPRYTVTASGTTGWGAGAGAVDATLERVTTGVMRFTSTELRASGATSATATFGTHVVGDAVPRWTVDAAGKTTWGSGAGVTDATLERLSAGILRFTETRARISGATTSTAAVETLATGDSTGRLTILAGGSLLWGDGTSAADITAERISAGLLRLKESQFQPTAASSVTDTLSTQVTGDSVARLKVTAAGKMSWGGGTVATDAALERVSAGIMRFSETELRASGTAAASAIFGAHVTGDGSPRFTILASGKTGWGAGAGAVDMTLERASSTVLRVTGPTLDVFRTGATGAAFGSQVDTDGTYRWYTDVSGKHYWGDGTAAADVTLYRSAANRLKTDDLVDATTMGLATFTKAGTPSDADWAVAPPIGTIAIDTTNFYLYVRTAAATWKRTATLV